METMINVFHANAYITSGAAFTFIVLAHFLIQSWRRHKFSGERQRAIARLRSLERKQPLEAARLEVAALHEEVAPLHEIKIDRADNSCLWSDPEQATNQESLLHDPTGSQAADPDVPLEPKLKRAQRLPLLVGTKVQAARDFGPIKEGTPGIITDVADLSFFVGLDRHTCAHLPRTRGFTRAPDRLRRMSTDIVSKNWSNPILHQTCQGR
jgi:hypothetical protein